MMQALTTLPALRQELAIHPGPVAADGAPTWTLHDPSDNRFFQLSWPAFEILSRWRIGDAAALLAAVHAETTLELGEEDVEGVFGFLQQHHLLAARTAQDSALLARSAGARRMSKPMWLLKHYLFFRLPLVRPMPLLRVMLPRIAWIYTPVFWWSVLGVAVLGLYLVSQQWDSFTHTFAAYSGLQGVLGIGLALSVAKVAHELGHAFTAYRHGCRVPSMGVAFLVMVPVLYTDTNEAWKLPARRERLQIGVAGMAAEIALAALATLLWSFLPDGPLRAGVFLLATSTWLITLAINTSPFMRFDGYFLLSDFLDTPNLHERAFALGRWQLREWLFGWGDPVPEEFPPARQRFLVGFAYATWIYRLALFLGIAFLVYHLFFKVLGIVLLAVELGWFIGRPMWQEVRVWWQRRSELRWSRVTRRTVMVFATLCAIVLIPWPRGVNAPAVLGAADMQWLYAPAPARVGKVLAAAGQTVARDAPLIELDSAELFYRLSSAQAREHKLRWQVAQQAFNPALQELGATLQQRWDGARAEVAGIEALTRQLTLRAAFAGKVVDRNPALNPGSWVTRGEALMQIASPQGVKIEAYVDEQSLALITPGQSARFIADEPDVPAIECQVDSVDHIAVTTLDHPALASPAGGPIPALADRNGRMLPRDNQFRVLLRQCEGLAGTARELTGTATIGRAYQSLAAQWGRTLTAVLRREQGL